MNEENKYKLVFGEQVLKKEFRGLQNEAKLMKPASMNKLLGKRDWDVNLLTQSSFNKNLAQPPQPIKKKKLKRSSSLMTILDDFSTNQANEEPDFLLRSQAFEKAKKVEKNHSWQPKCQLETGTTDLKERANRKNLNDNLAYDLGKLQNLVKI